MANVKAPPGAPANRPLSPHIQIYAPLLNMVMSIVHRLTGAALYLGVLLLAWWLVAVAAGPTYYANVNGLFGTWPGQIVLIGYTWALMHHMLGGVRHLIWDTGRGFAPAMIDALCWATIVGSVALTAVIWVFALWLRGAL